MKPSIYITKSFTEEIAIDQLANWFWVLSTEERVDFLNSVAEQAKDWFGSLENCRGEIAHTINNKNKKLTIGVKHILKSLSC